MMKISYLVALILIMFLTIQDSFGQRKIQGAVVEVVRKKAMQGVAVQIVGTQIGTITDINGNFTITLSESKSNTDSVKLLFSSLGYSSIECIDPLNSWT